MKTLSMLIVLVAAIFSSHAYADSQSANSFRFDCGTKKMPSQQAFARVMGIDNLAEAYDERLRVRSNLLRQCHEHKAIALIVQVKTLNIQTIAKK